MSNATHWGLSGSSCGLVIVAIVSRREHDIDVFYNSHLLSSDLGQPGLVANSNPSGRMRMIQRRVSSPIDASNSSSTKLLTAIPPASNAYVAWLSLDPQSWLRVGTREIPFAFKRRRPRLTTLKHARQVRSRGRLSSSFVSSSKRARPRISCSTCSTYIRQSKHIFSQSQHWTFMTPHHLFSRDSMSFSSRYMRISLIGLRLFAAPARDKLNLRHP